MRRALSAILFVIGGWLLMTEPVVAFINFGDPAGGAGAGAEAMALVGALALVIAAVPLALATALSPGDRRQELGLTILLSVAAAIFCALAALATFLDPGMKRVLADMPPMPRIELSPFVGIANLVVLAAIGWILWRRPRRSQEAAPDGLNPPAR